MSRARWPEIRLADELYLAAHDHDGGRVRARLHPAVLSLGLAGALLAELIVAGSIGQRDGYVFGAGRRMPADDEVSWVIANQIAGEPGHSVPVWLMQLSNTSTDRVRGRLCDAGVLQERPGRRWWGGSTTTYVANDLNTAQYPEAELYGLVRDDRREPPDLRLTILAGLAEATGLIGKLALLDRSDLARQRLTELRSGLPEPLRGLLAHTGAAAGAALLSSGHH